MPGTISNNGQLNASAVLNEVRDGWDNEEWGSLEEDPVNTFFFYYKKCVFIVLFVCLSF